MESERPAAVKGKARPAVADGRLGKLIRETTKLIIFVAVKFLQYLLC